MQESKPGIEASPSNRREGNYGVILPCAPEEFGAFVSSLLGKPQTIERQIYGVFEISKEDVVNAYHLVDQRIHQQNEAVLVQFSVRIIYDDDSSVLLNSMEDFQNYTEIRPITSVGASLSWSYLIKFKNKSAPEKQEIDLSFRSDLDGHNEVVIDDGILIRKHTRYGPRGIFLRVSHTERTWGVDIESLLTNHIKSLVKPSEESERFVSRHSGTIGFIAGVLFFLGALAGVIYTASKFIDTYTAKIAELTNSTLEHAVVLSSKIDFLVDVISTGAWPKFIFSVIVFLVICLVMSILIGIWVGGAASSEPRSFVLLSKSAEDKRLKVINRMKRDWLIFWISVVTSIGTGIVANLIFTKYFSGVL